MRTAGAERRRGAERGQVKRRRAAVDSRRAYIIPQYRSAERRTRLDAKAATMHGERQIGLRQKSRRKRCAAAALCSLQRDAHGAYIMLTVYSEQRRTRHYSVQRRRVRLQCTSQHQLAKAYSRSPTDKRAGAAAAGCGTSLGLATNRRRPRPPGTRRRRQGGLHRARLVVSLFTCLAEAVRAPSRRLPSPRPRRILPYASAACPPCPPLLFAERKHP